MSSPKTPLSEARITAYLRGELGDEERADVERQMDEEPQWLSVLAVLAEDLGGGSVSRGSSEGRTTGGETADRLTRAHAQRLHAGDVLGRFEVLHSLGRGGMGTVYAAKDTTLGRVVALKLLRAQGRSRREKLLAEARALARMNHENVITVHDVGADGDRVYLAMERVDGQTLLAWRLARPRTVDEVLAVFEAAGRGLAAAHAVDLVHRDIKPTNIMVAADGRVLVLDFGLAVELDVSAAELDDSREASGVRHHAAVDDNAPAEVGGSRSGERTVRAGTPAYMSPEQRRGEVCFPASDQFSFCVALYEALVGTLPPEAEMGGRPAAFGPALGRMPRRVTRALERGLSAAPSDRFGSMAALLGELRPRRRVRERVLGSMGLGALAVVTAVALDRPAPDTHSCSGASEAVASTWGPARAEVVRASLSAEGSSWAVYTAERVVQGLDAYAQGWTETFVEVCETHRSDLELEGAMRCLDRSRRALEAVARVLEGPHADGPVHAQRALDGLPSPRRCDSATPASEALSTESQEILQQVAHAQVLQESAELEEAQSQAEAALERARAASDIGLEAKARLVLAWVHHDAGRFDAAAEELRLALAGAMTEHDDETATTALHRLVWVVGYKQGDHRAGRKLAQQAEAWSVRSGRPYDAEFSRDLSMGWISHDAGDLEAAASFFRAAIELAKAQPDDVATAPYDVGLGLNGLGAALVGVGDLEAADEVFGEAVALIEAHLGPEHPRLAQVLNNRASVLRGLARPQDAYDAFMRSRAVFVARQGPTHVAVGQTDVNLAIVCSDLQRFEESVTFATQAIDVFEAMGDAETPLLARGYSARGDAQLNLGRHDEAFADLHRALSIDIELLGPDHPRVGISLSNVSLAYDKMGRPKEAEEHQRRGLEVLLGALGPDHSLVATAQLNLAFLLRARGAKDDAIALYAEAIPNAAPTTKPLLLLGQGETLLDVGRAAEAIVPLTEASKILVGAPASTGSRGEALFLLARAQLEVGRRKEAAASAAESATALVAEDEASLLDELRSWAAGARVPLPAAATAG